MATTTLSEVEQRVVDTFALLEKEDPDGAWNWFYASIINAAGDEAELVCSNLRRRKILKGQGRGKFASYYLTDKGRGLVRRFDDHVAAVRERDVELEDPVEYVELAEHWTFGQRVRLVDTIALSGDAVLRAGDEGVLVITGASDAKVALSFLPDDPKGRPNELVAVVPADIEAA